MNKKLPVKLTVNQNMNYQLKDGFKDALLALKYRNVTLEKLVLHILVKSKTEIPYFSLYNSRSLFELCYSKRCQNF